ncbi:ABC transporter ATP-binding protein/permease [Roseateles amylovorans]|uniref:ABC transporter ATP-binding protein/permease n=1 Tax=Roseateles amylovorans TaxID=2978473 RepID=A0ABY6B9Y2_9BURK|nr:ABC transporter ATP-binding protein/permease [Roseateles amylovorans]UXH80375.1 ABC transporter ATP-binding protein/permease [Roseateles amylovorans]
MPRTSPTNTPSDPGRTADSKANTANSAATAPATNTPSAAGARARARAAAQRALARTRDAFKRKSDSPRRQPPRLSAAAWRQFLQLAKPYWQGDKKRAAWGLLTLLVVLMLCETQLAVMLNDKTGEMTSALAARDHGRFWLSVRDSLMVLAFAVPVYAFYYYMRDAFSNHWRRWLTGRFLDGYLDGRKYYDISRGSAASQHGDIDNPDQRISEDLNTFTGRSTHFLLMMLGSAMQLVAFCAVLWSLSKPLVAFLAVYATTGTFLALYVFGSPLIKLNFWQLRREADFRFGLMRLRENAESIAFYRGEPQERAQIEGRFEAVYDNYAKLIRKQRSLNLFQRGFSQLTLVVPSVILADSVLSGQLEVGAAVQAAGAFAAVLTAVSLIVDNFESLSRFVAGIDRLHALSEAVLHNKPPTGRERERIASSPAEQLALREVTLYTPQFDRLLVDKLNLQLKPGESLLITGVSGCGKSSLLRAIAGLWRTGSGTIEHPPMEDVFFLPQRPYLQPGSLRSQMIYPDTRTDLDDDTLRRILDEVSLPELVDRVGGLDAVQDWEKLLSMGEQQRLAFARVLVRRPKMVILDEATSALDGRNEHRLYQRLCEDGVTLVSIAHRPAVLRHHTHVLRLHGGGEWSLHPAEGFAFESDDPEAADPRVSAGSARGDVRTLTGTSTPALAADPLGTPMSTAPVEADEPRRAAMSEADRSSIAGLSLGTAT